MKKPILLLLVLCLILTAALAGCTAAPSAPESPASEQPSEPAEAPEAPAEVSAAPDAAAISVTDMMGREISLSGPAQKIVVLSAADCEIVYALGAASSVVGRGEYCDYPAEVLDITPVQSGSETNLEQIIALEPDVLLMSAMDQSEEQTKALEEAGITVVVSDADTIEETYTSIELIGAVTGKADEAAALTESMKSMFAEVSASAAKDSGETVYFEVSPLEYGLWTAGANTFMNEIAGMLGLENCFADVEGWAEISEEQIIERDPDYIVTISMFYGEGPTPVEEILSRKGWENVTAVKNAAVLNLQNNELSRPAPRLADGAKAMSDFITGIRESLQAAA